MVTMVLQRAAIIISTMLTVPPCPCQSHVQAPGRLSPHSSMAAAQLPLAAYAGVVLQLTCGSHALFAVLLTC